MSPQGQKSRHLGLFPFSTSLLWLKSQTTWISTWPWIMEETRRPMQSRLCINFHLHRKASVCVRGLKRPLHFQADSTLIKKKEKFPDIYGLPKIWGNAQIFSHIWGGLWSYKTLHPTPSEFPYIWEKFCFLSFQCSCYNSPRQRRFCIGLLVPACLRGSRNNMPTKPELSLVWFVHNHFIYLQFFMATGSGSGLWGEEQLEPRH